MENQQAQPSQAIPPIVSSVNPMQDPVSNNPFPKIAIIVIAVLILVLLGCVGFILMSRKNKPITQISTTPTSNPTQKHIQITQLRPDRGPVGTLVDIEGTGFTDEFNIIQFGSDNSINSNGFPNNAISHTSLNTTKSSTLNHNGTPPNLEFIVPYMGEVKTLGQSQSTICNTANHCEAMTEINLKPGIYPVSITNGNGHSNSLNFTVMSLDSGKLSTLVPGWKTYIDTTYGFTIDYPSSGNVNYQSDQPYVNDNEYSLNFNMGGTIRMSFNPNSNKLSATDYVKQEAFKKDLPGWNNNKKPIIPLHLTGIDAVEVNSILGGSGPFGSEVFIADGTNIISLLASDSSAETENNLQKMVSTFKFTN